MVIKIKIDYKKCTGCKRCVKTCTYSVLEWLDGDPLVINPRECKECEECSLNCPVEAISIEVS